MWFLSSWIMTLPKILRLTNKNISSRRPWKSMEIPSKKGPKGIPWYPYEIIPYYSDVQPLRTSKQLHLEHQNCSKYALRTSEKQILRTSPDWYVVYVLMISPFFLRELPIFVADLEIFRFHGAPWAEAIRWLRKTLGF